MSPEIAEFLQVISTQTERLIRMADDLVTMTSLDAGNVALEPEPTMLVPTLEALVRDLPDGDRVLIRLADTAPARIETDAMRLGQALTNLLAERPEVFATRPLRRTGGRCRGRRGVRFSVIDEGVGIEPGELDRVFELFYRTREGRQDRRWIRAGPRNHAQDGERARWGGHRLVDAGRRVDVLDQPAVGGSLSTRSTVFSRVMGLKGFVKYSSAPMRIARSRPSSPSAVTMMTRDRLGRRVSLDAGEHLRAARPRDVHV